MSSSPRWKREPPLPTGNSGVLYLLGYAYGDGRVRIDHEVRVLTRADLPFVLERASEEVEAGAAAWFFGPIPDPPPAPGA